MRRAPIVWAWIGGRDLQVSRYELVDGTVNLYLEGPDTRGDVGGLATDLAVAFGTPVDLDVRYVASTSQHAEAAP